MMAQVGTLDKLKVLSFNKPDYSDSKGEIVEFTACVNPNEITLSYEIEYNSASGAGTTNSPMNFLKAKPGDLTLSFYIDGTGANGKQVDVQKTVEDFQMATGYSGKIHRTKYLKIIWGTLQVKRCVLKSATIAYKLFKPDGIPLRAVITAVFADNSDDKTRIAMARDESADLMHIRQVKAGDTLPGLCYRVYGDPGYYIDIARVNGLDNFRRLIPGMRIIFPPLETRNA
jgi:hypothetical protein